jgi:hypothetical protein
MTLDAKCRYTAYHYAEFSIIECRYADCLRAECCDAQF